MVLQRRGGLNFGARWADEHLVGKEFAPSKDGSRTQSARNRPRASSHLIRHGPYIGGLGPQVVHTASPTEIAAILDRFGRAKELRSGRGSSAASRS